MGKFNEYTEKVTPDDVDIFLLQDASATKKTTFLSIFNQIKTKLGLGLLATKSKISEEELETALLNLINGKLTASGMANDLITTDATKALAAPQGKKLLEYIGTLTQLTTVEKANLVGAVNELVSSVDSLNRNLNTLSSNSFTPGGTYMGSLNNAKTPGAFWCNFSSITDGPVSSGFGYLEVVKSSEGGYLQRVTIFSSSGNFNCHVRYYTNSQWYSWGLMTYTR